jgi:iron complex transport system substrate-binding protein
MSKLKKGCIEIYTGIPLFPHFGRGDKSEVGNDLNLLPNFKFVNQLSIILLFLFSFLAHAQEPPQRVISLAPNITEIIFKLGAQDRLVGRTEFCTFPDAAKEISSIGGYLNPDYEKIVDLQPDVIFLLPNTEMERKLQHLGLHIFSIPDETIEEVLFSIKAVGRVLALDERAEEIAQGIQDTLDLACRADTSNQKISAVLVVGRESGSLKGLYVAGKDTYLSEIWTLCGGKNIFDDIDIRYFSVSKEDLVSRNPDIILEFRIVPASETAQKVPALKSDWRELNILNAVSADNVFIFTDRYFLIPGPRISKIAVSFLEILEGMRQ